MPGSGCFQIFHGNVPKIQGQLACRKVSSLPAMQEVGFVLPCKSWHPFLNTNLLCKSLETLPWVLQNTPLWWINKCNKLIVYNAKNLGSPAPTFFISWFGFHSLTFALVKSSSCSHFCVSFPYTFSTSLLQGNYRNTENCSCLPYLKHLIKTLLSPLLKLSGSGDPPVASGNLLHCFTVLLLEKVWGKSAWLFLKVWSSSILIQLLVFGIYFPHLYSYF